MTQVQDFGVGVCRGHRTGAGWHSQRGVPSTPLPGFSALSRYSAEDSADLSPSDTYGDLFPEFSPDGKRVAFARKSSCSAWDIWLQPVPSGEPTRLTHENYDLMGRPAWTGDGREVIFAARYALFRVPLAGGAPQAVAGIGENAGDPTIWRNQMIFTQSLARQSTIWRVRGQITEGGIALLPHSWCQPALSSTWTTLQTARSSPSVHGDPVLLRFGYAAAMDQIPSRSPSCGKWPQIPVGLPTAGRLPFQVGLRRTRPSTSLTQTEAPLDRLTDKKSNDEVPTWSRDGKWIFFSSNRSGTFQVCRIPSEGGRGYPDHKRRRVLCRRVLRWENALLLQAGQERC